MGPYRTGAILKIIIGISILATLYHYVNVYEDPAIGISFGFLGIFMVIWGVSYFVFLLGYSLFSTAPKHLHSSKSYKHSLMTGMYVMVNLTLIITDSRNKWIGILLLVAFVIIEILFSPKKKPTSTL